MKGEPRAGYPEGMPRFAELGVSGGMIDLMAVPPLEVLMRVRGREETRIDRATGASFVRRRASLGGETKTAYFVHPPYRKGTGYTSWTAEADVPHGAVLTFDVGMGAKSPERSDGVWFRVLCARLAGGHAGEFERIFEVATNEHRWLHQRVPLDRYAGARVRFAFVADCGPAGNSTTDHAYWADVRILGRGVEASAITPHKRHMTWIDGRAAESGFYFRHVRSRRIDITFAVEGNAPVSVESVSVHAHPDAMYRAFEKGLVLANPSERPYTFDLRSLAPGRRYRRLRATPSQDAATNTGRPVGDSLTVGAKDAIFLVRRP
jgi:hypothetical protein